MTPVFPMIHINQPADDAMQLEPLYKEWPKLTNEAAVYIRLWPVTNTLNGMEAYLRDRVAQITANKPKGLKLYIGFDFGGGGFDCSWADFFNLERWQWARQLVILCQKLSGERPVPVILENRATDECYAGDAYWHGLTDPWRCYSELKGLDIWFDLPVPRDNHTRAWLSMVAEWQPAWWQWRTPKWKILAANNGCSDVSLDHGGSHHQNYLRHMAIFGVANTIERVFVARSGVLADGQECFDPRHYWIGGNAPGPERQLKPFLEKRHHNSVCVFLEKQEVGPVALAMQKWYVKP